MILATRELLPSVVLDARNSSVAGFVVEKGTSLSHAAILAKSLGFPILRIDDLQMLQELAGEEILVDTTRRQSPRIAPTPRWSPTAHGYRPPLDMRSTGIGCR